MALEIEKGRFADEYTSIGLKLVSECESDLARNTALYREPLASNNAFLGDIKWERECPKVDWDVTTYNRFLHYTASKNTGSYINMTLLNPDPLNLWSKDYKEGDTKKTNHLVHPHLEFVRIPADCCGQYLVLHSLDVGAMMTLLFPCAVLLAGSNLIART